MLSVSLTLTDGGTVSAARHFTVSVAASHLYWAEVGPDTIGRANLDGTGADNSFVTTPDRPIGVAVDSGHVYWADGLTFTIGRANLDGTGADNSFLFTRCGPTAVAAGY